MLSILAVIGCVAVFMTPGLCCLSKEYATSSGQCCPMCIKGHGLTVVQECTATRDTDCGALPGYFCKDLTHDTGC
ncbi:tumor necrosis factor receptor superfamily member 6-like [Plectropomus leopardus]|uniref:tumor necrosis factor receptor superfamily member 6-like n=1 Tax=Plectropomus leopardus TaxID=160734 RepID=UPI001C4B537F|nr:tumor necrosis factor receptor superfamily member 6-like [Plectropomus leopardus]